MSRPEEGFANPTLEALRRFLLRYQPFIVTVAAIALIALLLPGKTTQTATETTTASDLGAETTQAALGVNTGPATTDAGGSAAPAATTASASAPVQSQVLSFAEARKRGVALVRNCDARLGRVMIPSFSAAPCVPAFNGNNGGVTYQGVTRDKIKVAVYLAPEDPAADAILKAAGADDSREEVMQQYREWGQFYEKHFNMWGRKVEFHFVDGSGDSDDDAAARADALKVAKQIKAFASLGSANNTYVNEVTSRGVMCMCTVELPNAFYQRWAPHVWSTLQSADQTYVLLTEYITKRLANRKAQWAGDVALQQNNRVFGLLAYETHDYAYKSAHEFFRRELAKHGIKLHVAYFNGYPQLTKNQEQARPIIQRLKEAKVSTVICGCDPFAPIFFTQEATRQLYRPEWMVTGSALTDTSFFGRTYDQEQWSRAYGLGQLVVRLEEAISDSYRIYKWHFNKEPTARAAYGVIRAPVDLFYRGVHMAGPRLTPKTFEAGMFAHPLMGGRGMKTVPSVTFGKKVWNFNDYTAFDDVTEIWWDRTAQGKDEIGNDRTPGMYRYVLGGKRYIPGMWPRTLPNVFKTEGTVTVYKDYPPGERPPQYPRPSGN